MSCLSALLFGISASLDALLVGIGYGLRRIHVRIWQNLFISLISLLGTCLSAGIGKKLLPLLPAVSGGLIGSLILMILGIYYLGKGILSYLHNRSACRPDREAPEAASTMPPSVLTCPETLLLGLTLSANNIGISLSASLAGLPLLPCAVSTFVCAFLFLLLGNLLGRSRFFKLLGSAADPLSGLLLIGLAVMQLVL